ncbi:Copper resistance protein D [Candidatus Sodalis pierantonius str. SOPE]|uniref:Copper resistance protein D n=1 Tax=Candidatus Sodalis pierantonii str. SOPE TaxID=2342 RepID=W0HJ86_9GAMM|nr:copper homeostasis membrane protein CopD [Candidatus Sodalis pierantonius]AHF73839.1 Copper resistance protein D [Candidatus Sodalis pierantonius str. SOPE]
MASLLAWFAACRFIHFAALIQLAGVLLFSERLAPPALQPLLRRAFRRSQSGLALVGLLTAIALLALQAGLMGQGWPDTLRLEVWRAVLHTSFGQVWFWHLMLALATCGATLGAPASPWRYPLLLMLSMAALLSLAFTGHAAMYDGLRGVAQRCNQMLHLLAVAGWLGGLWPRLLTLRWLRRARLRAGALTALMAYSRSGHVWVALVILTGVLNTFLVLGHWPLELGQPYSRMLLIKTAAVAAMVMLALTNRYRVVPTMRTDEPRAIKRLTLLTLMEIALGALALLLVSVFAMLEPQ